MRNYIFASEKLRASTAMFPFSLKCTGSHFKGSFHKLLILAIVVTTHCTAISWYSRSRKGKAADTEKLGKSINCKPNELSVATNDIHRKKRSVEKWKSFQRDLQFLKRIKNDSISNVNYAGVNATSEKGGKWSSSIADTVSYSSKNSNQTISSSMVNYIASRVVNALGWVTFFQTLGLLLTANDCAMASEVGGCIMSSATEFIPPLSDGSVQISLFFIVFSCQMANMASVIHILHSSTNYSLCTM
jgi:hypothetical protein